MFRTRFITLRAITFVLLAGAVAAVNGCGGFESQKSVLGGELRIIAFKEPRSRLRRGEGFEYDLLLQFSASQKAHMTWTWVDRPKEALAALESGKADIAAGLGPFLFSSKRHDTEMAYTNWYQLQNRRGQISRIRGRYFGFQDSLSEKDRVRFFKTRLRQMSVLLPKFKRYSHEFELPWQLLAAVAYQESHWEDSAQSQTGVRGLPVAKA